MLLEADDGSRIEAPSTGDIRTVLGALHTVGGTVTLSNGQGLSVHATPAPEGKYRLEYRDAPKDEFYRARTRALAPSTVLNLFGSPVARESVSTIARYHLAGLSLSERLVEREGRPNPSQH